MTAERKKNACRSRGRRRNATFIVQREHSIRRNFSRERQVCLNMRILITTDWYKPVVNGVVTSVDSLTRGLTAAGHDVRVLTLSQSIHSSIAENVYYIASVSAGIVYENARVKLMTQPEILWDIFDWKPDIVHSQCEFSTFGIAREIVY